MKCEFCDEPSYQSFIVEGRKIFLCETHCDEELDNLVEDLDD